MQSCDAPLAVSTVLAAARLRRLSQHLRMPCNGAHRDQTRSSARCCVVAGDEGTPTLDKAQIFELRKAHFCEAQSVSYSNTDPLLIMRGEGAMLFDEHGVGYLDTRNNVAHVGHSHPRVADAVARQVVVLNTNARYLHPHIVNLATRLTATMPEPLSVCVFVNSGSEANDLALRMARTHTGKSDVVVVERAYHGHTTAVIDISPYKYENEGGLGKQDWVHKVPCPDTYRGLYRGANDAYTSLQYANHVAMACDAASKRAQGTGVAAFFVESGMSVAGVVLPPTGYLRAAYSHVRAAGGICIADEVQVGFGRFGSVFWGFQQQGVVPDIVTLGKPFGNGMPLAAVVTTRAIAASFHNGLEYFNTFGGNPVCCAAGLAVLDIIEQEGLQAHALRTGEYLMAAMRALATRHALSHTRIGDVRGIGLFVGVEFVTNNSAENGTRSPPPPATAATSMIVSKMKSEHKILLTIDGPHDNVLVFKPPMCFGKLEVDRVVQALDDVMTRLLSQEVDAGAPRTPT